jgi:methionyl aminopeptidase
MIPLKNDLQIAEMRKAGRITAEAMEVAAEHIREGVSTYDIDRAIRRHIEKRGARPTFLGYGGFPGSACISINSEVIHGIPSRDRILREGDIVKIDVGAFYRGFTGDMARTFPVGRVSDEALRLIEVTKRSFFCGVENFREGNRIGDIGHAIQSCVEAEGFSVVRRYIGHGVGRELHEDPEVPNFGTAGRGVKLCVGMTLAIEPMVNIGKPDVREGDDGWTVTTADGSLSAHYENSVALTHEGTVILTAL